MITKGNTDLTIIQGDTLSLTIRLENVELTSIDKVYFSCSELNITKAFEQRDDIFELNIDCEETCDFKPSVCCYDITILFTNKKVKTIEYRGKISVLKKVNVVKL